MKPSNPQRKLTRGKPHKLKSKMEKQKVSSIYGFKIGTPITRVQPAKPYIDGGQGDRSYMGDKLIFRGIANGQIYLERTGIDKEIFSGKLIDISLDLWDEDWVEFIDIEKTTSLHGIEVTLKHLNRLLKEAEKREDYEEAGKIKKEISKRK